MRGTLFEQAVAKLGLISVALPPQFSPAEADALLAEIRLLANITVAARELYERVEMDESVGICLSERESALRLGQALEQFDKRHV